MFASEGSSLCCLNNEALQAGGAIFASKPDLTYGFILLNRRCFIQYNGASGVDASPDEWEVRLLIAASRALNMGPWHCAWYRYRCGVYNSMALPYISEDHLVVLFHSMLIASLGKVCSNEVLVHLFRMLHSCFEATRPPLQAQPLGLYVQAMWAW